MQSISFHVAFFSQFAQETAQAIASGVADVTSRQVPQIFSELTSKISQLFGRATETERTSHIDASILDNRVIQRFDTAMENSIPPTVLQIVFEYTPCVDIMEWAVEDPSLLTQKVVQDRVLAVLQDNLSHVPPRTIVALVSPRTKIALSNCASFGLQDAVISRLARHGTLGAFQLHELCALKLAFGDSRIPNAIEAGMRDRFAAFTADSFKNQRADELLANMRALVPLSNDFWKDAAGTNRVELLHAMEAEFLANDNEKLQMCSVQELCGLISIQSGNRDRGHPLCLAIRNRMQENCMLRFCNSKALTELFCLPFPAENTAHAIQNDIIRELLRNGAEKLHGSRGEDIFRIIQQAEAQWIWSADSDFWRATQAALLRDNAAKLRCCIDSQRHVLANAFSASPLFEAILQSL